MVSVRKASDRGTTTSDWLKSHHSFSFGDYYDPKHHHFGNLRVINEDFIAPANGFQEHPHRDMEIVTYMIAGELEHRDSLGNHFVLKAGDVQRMTAGTGIVHSEVNPSGNQECHLLQIWIYPESKGLLPQYEQIAVGQDKLRNRLALIGSPDGGSGAVRIHQNVKLFASSLDRNERVSHQLESKDKAWVQLITGGLQVNDAVLSAGDGAAIEQETLLTLKATEPAHFLLFHL